MSGQLLSHFTQNRQKKILWQFLLFLQIFPLLVVGSEQEYAISIYALEKLALADLSTIKEILKFKEENEIRGENVEEHFTYQIVKYLQDFEESTRIKIIEDQVDTGARSGNFTGSEEVKRGWTEKWMKEIASKLSENPISAYRLIQRTALFLPPIVETAPKNLVFSSELVKDRKFPDEKDIEAATDGIIRLNQHYNFPESQLADGVFGEMKTGIKMNARQCFEIGLRCRELGRYTPSFEWLTLALKKTVDKNDDSMGDVNIEQIRQELELTKDEGNLDTSTEKVKRNRAQRENVTLRPIGRQRVVFPVEGMRYFSRICAGNNYQTEEDKSQLFCWREFSVHPIHMIGPLKIEFLSRDPDIIQIYDFLGHESTEWLKAQALDPLKSNNYPTIAGAADVYSAAKDVARVHTIVGSDCPQQVQKLHRRIEQATGLQIIKGVTAETLAVGSYNFAGHYKPHTDTLAGDANNPLPRIASFLIYLSDTHSGGYTSFCSVGVGARPIKGSAIFWYNLQLDGKPDMRTLHGACPPILSRKIVAQLWIRPYKNFDPTTFTRLSERMKQRRRFRFKVNGKISQVKK